MILSFQLCLSVHRHRSIECDRGCEGNDSNSSDDDDNDTTETESGESSWEFGSLSGPFSSNTGVDLRFLFNSTLFYGQKIIIILTCLLVS